MKREPLISVKNVQKRYGRKVVHQGIDLEVYRGEILTLMGGSGSGKSVLLRSLIGLEKPDSGQIHFEGHDIAALGEDELVEVRKKIAYVFQYGALFDSMTIEENLAYPLREHSKLNDRQIHERVVSILKKVGLAGNENLLPANLSGGMQRRVGVARSIILEPDVILYDEPTTGLDPFNSNQILKIMVQLKQQGATSILVTHDIASIFEVADRIAFLKDGRIYALGTAEEFKHTKDAYLKSFINGETE